MKHPVHGFHVPMPGERESMLKNGWVDEVDAPVAPAQGGYAVTGDVGFVGNPSTAIVPIKRGPGRPRKAA
jgi:hypothetical protein